MTVLIANALTKYYGPDEVFSDVSVDIPPKSRIALVGPNGAGKTTLINILAGYDSPTEGTVQVAKQTRIGYLPQRPELAGNHTLWEEQLRAFDDLIEMEARLKDLENRMSDPDQYDAVMADYGPLQAEFDHRGGYTYELRIKMILTGVGFSEEDYTMPLTLLSGGQKTRALLARLLLDEPELLILDEPTNHLDIAAVEWLENFLKDFPGAVLAVSHDRYFIDHFASTVWELEFHGMEVYRGNYTHYIQQREERRERILKEFEAQQEFIAKEEDYIRKHMGSRWTAQAKGRLKKLETMKKRGKIISGPPRNRKKMFLDMQAKFRSGDKVLMTRSLKIGYHDDKQVLLDVPDITLYRNETAALIGPNGVGKTTFLKTVTERLTPLSGEVRIGASVQLGYFAQAHEELDPSKSVLDEITESKPMQVSEARNYLGRFLFSGDDVFRNVSTLSGGERGRLALAKLSLSGANLLLLDEPSNHLDIDSQEILQEVLEHFGGTILLVSHDRYLIDALATQIWYAQPGRLDVFEGPYQEYVAARNQRLEAEKSAAQAAKAENGSKTNFSEKKHGLNPYELKQRIAEIESHIHALEDTLDDITRAIETASTAGDADKIRELGEAYSQTEAELSAAMAEWEKLLD